MADTNSFFYGLEVGAPSTVSMSFETWTWSFHVNPLLCFFDVTGGKTISIQDLLCQVHKTYSDLVAYVPSSLAQIPVASCLADVSLKTLKDQISWKLHFRTVKTNKDIVSH